MAVTAWQMPVALALDSALDGAVYAVWPVMWIVVNALLLYNIAVRSGRFDAFRSWVMTHLPNDRRVVLVVIGFCFGALLEGIAGFGTPVAITSSLLIAVGFPPLEALVFVLIFNTAPVAFGALGTPVTMLGAVTSLPAGTLAAMIGRQLPVMAIILPFYVMALYGGWRSVRAIWPALLVAGASFGISQFLASNYIDYKLTDVLSSLGSLIVTVLFLRWWRPAPDPEFAINAQALAGGASASAVPAWQGWLPWLIVSALVIVWTHFKVSACFQRDIPWPGLHNAISITLYHDKPYAADLELPAAGDRDRYPGGVRAHRAGRPPGAGRVLELRRRNPPPGLAGGPHRDADRRPGLSDELLRAGLHPGPGGGLDGQVVRAVLAVPRLGGRDAFGQRHLRQRPLRQSAGGRRPAARPQPRALRGDQLVGRRHGQDDLAAEYRHRGFRHEAARARRAPSSPAPSCTASCSPFCSCCWS